MPGRTPENEPFQAEPAPEPPPDSALKSFLSGGFGGACLVLAGHPLDLIKVRMQTGAGVGESVWGILRTTFVKEGLRGLYRGVSAPLVAVSPMYAVQFWGYDMGKRLVRTWDNHFHPHNHHHHKSNSNSSTQSFFTTTQLCIAGGISAIPTTAIMAPSERIKCLLQVQQEAGGTPKYTGTMDCARHVYKEGGMASIYKGTGATLLRDIPASVVWFGTYEIVKQTMMEFQGMDPSTGSSLSPMAVLTAGGLAGMATWSTIIPLDTLKSRYQTAPPGKYSSLWDVYRQLMKEEGLGALYRGVRPAVIRAFPANAACFFGMEVARQALAFMD
jgi:solute carrier family 25 carnitine/acylcarnitine transporter 20/29